MDTPIPRTTLAGLAGGALWVAFPFGNLALDSHAPGAAGLVWFALTAVLGAALLVVGTVGLRARPRAAFGRLGGTGAALAALAVALMGAGLGVELVTLASSGELNAVGHAMTLVGFLLLLPGSVLLGVAVRRARVLDGARAAGAALVLTVPLGIALAAGAGALGIGGAESDFGFWLGLFAPYGIAWIVTALALRHAPRRVPVAA